MSLDDRMNAYQRDFEALKIPKINQESKEWICKRWLTGKRSITIWNKKIKFYSKLSIQYLYPIWINSDLAL
jgi:hypothetical protein